MHAEELWTSDTFAVRFLRTVMTPASWLYALGWQLYLATYQVGLKKSKEPHSPVVCVGNLVIGGTGKTPTTVHIADVMRELGYSVAISCSGYGSAASEAASIAPSGNLNARDWGDEAALLRWLRPEIPLIVGRRRVLAAQLCHESFPSSILLMDDGFQHLPLKKHLTLLLDPPQKNRRCLPAGPYREPPRNRERADVVISSEPGSRFRPVADALEFHGPSGESLEVKGEVSALCALARPKRFLEALRNLGLSVGSVVLRPDHDPLTDGNLFATLPAGIPVVVTGKDWVKLRERSDISEHQIVIASYSVQVEPSGEFRQWLQAKLNGIQNQKP